MSSDSLRIAFLNSWPAAAHEGSGTAVAIRHLERGLRDLGHEVVTLDLLHQDTIPSTELRIRFNLELDQRLAEAGPIHLVVGFDLDGFALDRTLSPPFVLCLKGVAADEARFAQGPQRRDLLTRARLERHNALKSHCVVVPSRYSAAVVSRLYRIPSARIQVVPEAVDVGSPHRLSADQPFRVGRPTILSVARQYRRKDTPTLLRAVAAVRDRLPEVHLRVIGGGPELPGLEELARKLGLTTTVTFDGPLSDDAAVWRAFREAHVFCLPSLQEGFGIVFVEALAAGLPVVAARAGAVPEVVPDGEAGILTPPGDSQQLAWALLKLLNDPELRARFGTVGRRRARDFAPEAVARQFLEATQTVRPPVHVRSA